VLPHVLLGRSTLPWEFRANDAGAPWLALLLFDGQESLGGALTKPVFLREYPNADGPGVWDHLLDARIGWLRPLPGTPDGALIVSRTARTVPNLGDAFTPDTAAVEAVLDR
jgi:hypothetical protein